MVYLIPRFEHFEIWTPLKRSIDASMSTGHLEPPTTGHLAKRLHIQGWARRPWVEAEFRESRQEFRLNPLRKCAKLPLR